MQKVVTEVNHRVVPEVQVSVSQGDKQDKNGKVKRSSWWMITEHVLAGIAWNG